MNFEGALGYVLTRLYRCISEEQDAISDLDNDLCEAVSEVYFSADHFSEILYLLKEDNRHTDKVAVVLAYRNLKDRIASFEEKVEEISESLFGIKVIVQEERNDAVEARLLQDKTP